MYFQMVRSYVRHYVRMVCVASGEELRGFAASVAIRHSLSFTHSCKSFNG